MSLKTKGARDMIMDPCWCELVYGKRHVADGCPTRDVTSSGTSVAADSDDPKNGGSKPEER